MHITTKRRWRCDAVLLLPMIPTLPGGFRWFIQAAMAMGTAVPRLLAASGCLSLMVKGCSEEEGLQLGSKTAAEVSLFNSSQSYKA